MRAGILANSLPAALRIYDEVKRVEGCEPFVILCPAAEESRTHSLARHLARLLLKRGRLKSLRLLSGRRVFLFQAPLDHPQSIARLGKLRLDVGLHKAGSIYRDPTIKAFRLGILNPHIGLLPEFRGRNVMEWSLILGQPAGITVFFIDSGIDTGREIVLREEVDLSHCASLAEARQYLFDLDARYFRRALELLRSNNFEHQVNDGSGRRYFVMSKLFRGVVEKIIEAKS
ncbi:MAG TPA: formyltransferase family protein [Pyrinomonadaceae bacterium]|jgi:methionyl-tRNA formyltransferase